MVQNTLIFKIGDVIITECGDLVAIIEIIYISDVNCMYKCLRLDKVASKVNGNIAHYNQRAFEGLQVIDRIKAVEVLYGEL